MPSFNRNDKIAGYVVSFPIKEGAYAETYRVKDNSGKNYFLKLANYAKLHRTQMTESGELLEVQITKGLNHPNLVAYHDSGEILKDGKRYCYLVHDFISGETAAQRTGRENGCSVYDAKEIAKGVLSGLKYLHSLDKPVLHNELTIQNVMLDLSAEKPVPKIIDFGYARYQNGSIGSFQREGLNPFYLAPEALNDVFSVYSDIYSVGAMLYHLLFGLPPYYFDISNYTRGESDIIDAVLAEKKKPLKLLAKGKFELDEQLINIVHKALSFDPDDRFQSADEFLKALNGDVEVNPPVRKQSGQMPCKEQKATANVAKGNGFADVAGMRELKEQLQSDVIDLLQNPEQAKELGLSLPNGMLFFGPPGCGKTFFAQKFAEEIGCNYQYIKCSDVASPYIHGGQGKIAAIFDEARKNAPTLLFFDEIDAMIMSREKQTNVSESGEVNEFLAQLNNCGENGVIVIGATNKPTEIDEAAIRSGRLELKYYIPQPDKETRKQIFEINLKRRKTDFGIDYDRLADLTENYISSDITLIINTAARLTFRRKERYITQEVLEEAISSVRPSLTIEAIRKHEAIRDAFFNEGISSTRKKIGF